MLRLRDLLTCLDLSSISGANVEHNCTTLNEVLSQERIVLNHTLRRLVASTGPGQHRELSEPAQCFVDLLWNLIFFGFRRCQRSAGT